MFGVSQGLRHQKCAKATKQMSQTIIASSITSRLGAQAVYGSIFGTITDQSGAPVVGAKLTVTSLQKNTKFEVIESWIDR